MLNKVMAYERNLNKTIVITLLFCMGLGGMVVKSMLGVC